MTEVIDDSVEMVKLNDSISINLRDVDTFTYVGNDVRTYIFQMFDGTEIRTRNLSFDTFEGLICKINHKYQERNDQIKLNGFKI